jgi:UDP-glucose 4-epimerase
VRRRVLLTGGTGFVGANVARRLLTDGHAVHLLVRPGRGDWRLDGIRSQVRVHEASLADGSAVEAVVRRVRPEWVFHLAAYGAYSWETDLDRMVRTNLVGTMNLVRSCLRSGFDAFVNTGSSSEYGFKSRPPTEHEWLEPNSHYAVTKAAATLFCRYTAQRERVHLPTLRLYSVYGPYEEPGRLMPTLILHGLDHRLPPLADPDVARDYVYVDDVSEAFVLAASRPLPEAGAVYNVGTGIQTSLREVVGVARRVLGIAADPAWGTMAKRQWDTSAWVANNQHVRSALGWTPRHSFEAGFRRMVAWMLERKATVHYYRARAARRLTSGRSPSVARGRTRARRAGV